MEKQLQGEALEIMLVLEDTVEYLCREHMLSGEKVWVMVGALADAKLKEFPEDDWQTGLFYNIFVTKGFVSTPESLKWKSKHAKAIYANCHRNRRQKSTC